MSRGRTLAPRLLLPPIPAVGPMKLGWLNRLKKLAWNVTPARSLILKFLVTLKSTTAPAGPIRLLRLIGELHHKPSLTEAGQVKLIQFLSSKPSAGLPFKYLLEMTPLSGTRRSVR